MKITIKQLRRIIREAISPANSVIIDKIKTLAQADPMQAFVAASSLPDSESMDLSFLLPGLIRVIGDTIGEQIPEPFYPELNHNVHGWDIHFEFADRPKRFHAADGMNLTDAQVEERENQEQELVDLAMSSIEEYSDLIESEFALIDSALVSEELADYAGGSTVEKTMTFVLLQSKVSVELETFRNTMSIRLKSNRNLR